MHWPGRARWDLRLAVPGVVRAPTPTEWGFQHGRHSRSRRTPRRPCDKRGAATSPSSMPPRSNNSVDHRHDTRGSQRKIGIITLGDVRTAGMISASALTRWSYFLRTCTAIFARETSMARNVFCMSDQSLKEGVPAASAVVRVDPSGSASQCSGMPMPAATIRFSARPSSEASKASSCGVRIPQSSPSSVTSTLPGLGGLAFRFGGSPVLLALSD